MTATIFNIQKFSINDGPGIRTTVFLKGCPLRCLWCHNPESHSTHPELFYDSRKCVLCGGCAAVCDRGCHAITPSGHEYHRQTCIACGRCVDACVYGALETVGREMTVEQVLEEVLADEVFYRASGGGMTLSGGEPMAHPAFTAALLRAAKEAGIHTAVETCGYTSPESLLAILPHTDLFLYDWKETDPLLHEQYTGVRNDRILENLELLDQAGASFFLRCPIIPTLNNREDHFAGIASLANRLHGIQEIHIEPYHPLGSGKAAMLGRSYELSALTFPEKADVEAWIQQIQAQTTIKVRTA